MAAMVHLPSEGVDRLLKEEAVPEAKYSCSSYAWAVMPIGLADSGSMVCPAGGGVLNTAGARQAVSCAADIVVGVELAELLHAASVPARTRSTALHAPTLLAVRCLPVRCSTVCSRPPPRVPMDAMDLARTQGDSSAYARLRLAGRTTAVVSD